MTLSRTKGCILLIAFGSILIIPAAAQEGKEPSVLWKYSTRGKLFTSPIADDKNIYIGSYDSSFYCLDSRTGNLNWQFKTGGQIGSTASIKDNRIFFFSSDGKLYCIDKSGKPLWQFKTFSGALPDRRYDWPDYYQSSPLIESTAVYFGAGDGRVYAVDVATGGLKWSFQTNDVVHTKPAVHREKLVVGSFDGNMYCLNKDTGSLIWRFKTTGQRYFPKGEINGNPVIHKNKVIFGARDYNLYALDLEAGYCHWLKTFPFGWALPVTPNDSVLYVGTSDDRMLLALDEETGSVHWRRDLGFNNFAGMALNENYGYTGTLNGKLFCVDLQSGEIRWTFLSDGYKKFRHRYFEEDDTRFVANIGKLLPNGDAILRMYEELGAVFSKPLVVADRIFMASNDGTVYCLRL